MAEVLSFLFQTREGVVILFVGGIALFAIIAFVMERKTRSLYVDRGEKKPGEDDEGWGGIFGD